MKTGKPQAMDKAGKAAEMGMARVTLTLPRDVVKALDAQVEAGAARNRSALAAELLRCAQQHRAGRSGEARAAGCVSVAYEEGKRGSADGLAAEERLAGAEVRVSAATEAALEGGLRLRVVLVRGRTGAIWRWAKRLEAVRGVRRVQVALTEVER